MDRPEKTSVQPLKKMPWTVSKKELCLMYNESRFIINPFVVQVQMEVRKLPKEEVLHLNKLLHKEFVILIEQYLDWPRGYEKFFREN